MKKITIILGLLLLAMLPAGAVKRIDANPINIAFNLSQETDPDGMAATLLYYGYESQNSNDGYSTFRHTNGSVIKYSFQDVTEAQPYPYVEVKSNRSQKETDDALKNLDFKSKGSGFIRNIGQHAKTETHCTHGSQGFLIFHREKNSTNKLGLNGLSLSDSTDILPEGALSSIQSAKTTPHRIQLALTAEYDNRVAQKLANVGHNPRIDLSSI